VALHTVLIAVGTLRTPLRQACDDYLTRLNRYQTFAEREIRAAPRGRPDGERRRDEGIRLVAALPAQATLIALDRAGDNWSSAELARRMGDWRLEARPLALVLGGAHGLDGAVLERARHRWSLGPLTLAHEVARLVVLEQWYRAWTILRGEPYHK
jgi:23S rRNA (pseudouridine1915-N3)-methyltransferase